MEELSLKLPNGADIRRLIQLAAQEFEAYQRGVAIACDKVTVLGQRV